jgi:hypothetical protein
MAVEGIGFDQRHAQGIASNRNGLCQAQNAHAALIGVQAIAVAAVEKRLAAA